MNNEGRGMMDNRPIGVMDSGIGGMTVVQALMKRMPNESIVYIGDTKHCPYGVQTIDDIQHYVIQQVVPFLMKHDIKALVLACNTATVAALDPLQRMLSIPVFGMIQSGSQAALKASHTKSIGIIATDFTIRQHAYTHAIQRLSPEASVVGQSCSAFVPLIEQGKSDTKEMVEIAQERLAPFCKNNMIDTLVLGCTHFPLIAPLITSIVGDQIQLVDPGDAVAKQVERYLMEHDMCNTSSLEQQIQVYVSQLEPAFQMQVERYLARHITLNEVILPNEK